MRVQLYNVYYEKPFVNNESKAVRGKTRDVIYI